MNLTFRRIEFSQDNVRLPDDRRRRGDRYVTSYLDKEGNEYRKSFFVPVGHGRPEIPQTGTHGELNAVKYQEGL